MNGVPGGNSSVGTISGAGLYVAPAAAPAGPVSVTATSVADPTLVATSTVTVTVPITVSVTPATASIGVGATQQFNATVTGSTNQAVTWSVNGVVGGNATVGTITAAGLYTAPSNLLLTQSFAISARSVADPTVSAGANVTVNVPVAVSVSPTSANVVIGATRQFTSTVTGSANTNVTWSVSAGGGSITAGGLYTAPATVPAGAVTVNATSVADPTKTATATVTVQPGVSVTVSPTTATVVVSQTQQFTATVTGTPTTAVTWSVTGGGSINPTTGLYTAPATVPAGTVTVTATSTDGTNTTGTATVTVVPPITVTVTPATLTMTTNQSQLFVASVTGTTNTAVTWTVSGGGTINGGTGLYTAPGTAAGPITITATSVADPTKTGTATVTVTAPVAGVFVSVFPRSKNLPVGKAQQFTAHVIRISDQSVTWSVNGVVGGNATVGTIDNAGVYSPPSVRPANPAITVTACSNQVPTACMTVNARIVANVDVSPASAKIEVSQTQQMTATVTGVTNTAVTWAVNGVPGGDATFGFINASGLYTAPSTEVPGLVRISATSAADSSAIGYATLEVARANFIRIFPLTCFTPTGSGCPPASPTQVMPGGRVQYEYQLWQHPQTISPGRLVNWFVNGVQGGNASVGTITPDGLYTAPQTPQTVTIEGRVAANPAVTVSVSLVIVAPTAASGVTLFPTTMKLLPYDSLIGLGANPLTISSARNQYTSWQVLVESNREDLTGVNMTVSDFTDASGNRIPATNATIYLEKYVNVPYPSRASQMAGEYPDPLIPKVDPFLGQTRNAFPFGVNRISPAYRIYPRSGGDTTTANFGVGRAASGGTFTGISFRHFVIEIDRGGSIGTATFRWSNDGGTTFAASNVPITASAIPLSDGVTVTFTSGGVAGATDFNVGNRFWIFAGPYRNQAVWFDLFVPGGTPPGTYNGTVTVVRQGKTNVTLTVTINVQSYTLATSAKVPSYFGMNWTNLQNAHFFNTIGPETMGLGHLYGIACLINRINCDTASVFAPTFTFNTDGSVATSSYTTYDQATAPLANGSITPHGEQLTILRLPRAGATPSEQYFATENLLQNLTTRGWRARTFDLSFDSPQTSGDFASAMTRASLVRSVDTTLRSLVTTDITAFNSNLSGYVTRWAPDMTSIEKKEFLDGPNRASRAFYDGAIAAGDELWWSQSCRAHDCAGTGSAPRFDGQLSFAIDSTALQNRAWGFMGVSPYKVTGIFSNDTVAAYARSFAQGAQRIDVWESTYYGGASGEGTLFYPGRPADIGGTNHVPVESLRLKMIRNAMVDWELAQETAAVNNTQVITTLRDNRFQNTYSSSPFAGQHNTTLTTFLSTLSLPAGTGGGVTVPAARGSYIDPVTGNRVHAVTDDVLCRGGSRHFYSFWPIWNQSGTHFIIQCLNWSGNSVAQTALLIRDSDLTVVGDALQGAPPGMNTLQLFWSWTNPNVFYGFAGTRLLNWDPFNRVGGTLFDFATVPVSGTLPQRARLAYVSFDDRYFLMELLDGSFNILGLAVWDRQAAPGSQIVGTIDLRVFPFYDQAEFTKSNSVWVVLNPGPALESRRYPRDFSTFVRPSEHGHHAFGLLRDGTPVAVKSASNRECPAGSLAGNPAGVGWKPTALMMDERINSPNIANSFNPLPSEVRRIACGTPGQHDLGHFSWNNTQSDFFFISTGAYSPAGTDPIADSIIQIRLTYNTSNQLINDTAIRLAPHRSEPGKYGYFALPRAACNQQGTRCIFSSSMTVNTNKTTPSLHLYIVDVP